MLLTNNLENVTCDSTSDVESIDLGNIQITYPTLTSQSLILPTLIIGLIVGSIFGIVITCLIKR